ncbi:MAG: rhodanese-like domain-containing protein [Akkermansia sp.]|nr:rhodanese-like domain-containing protein [Akkermansia sp.]MBQ7024116.1 rhodanese-like domain-containing protein [Akkermansia sp.]
MKDTFAQLIRLGFVILALAVVLYWVDTAWFAPRRLPVCVQTELPTGRVCLETVRAQYGDKVVWIDARSESDFEINHLLFNDNRMFPIRPGAQKQELMDAAVERLMEAGDRGECILVFCTNDCTSSEDIARELRELQITEAPIYVLEGGWDVLKAAGLVNFQ